MSVNVPVGSKVPIFLNVGDNNPNLFIRATIINQDDIEISNSPITLFNYGNGQYGYNDLIMPDTEYLSVTYDIFNDIFFTDSANYYSVTEVFPRIVRDDNTAYLSALQDNEIEVQVDVLFDEISVIVGKK